MLSLWRVVAGVMGVAIVLAGAAAGTVAGGVLGYLVSLVYLGVVPGDTFTENCGTCWLSVKAGAASGSVVGIFWAVQLWLKTLRPVMSGDTSNSPS